MLSLSKGIAMITEQDLRTVLEQLERGWNSGDGEAFAAPYAEDAEFVTVQGMRVTGRAAIAAGHQGIFDSIYAGSTNSMELQDTLEVSGDVRIALTRNTLSVPAGPLAGVRQAMSTNVLRRIGAGWEVVSTHNTIIEERR
jgi:uncharacterized protein (TIGR02246 family)